MITIFRDEARFLPAAVDSVVAQTLTSWELLLVDDGSTDASTALAREWAERRPGQIRYLEHPGHGQRGMGASRALGVAHARGELLAFLDADDVLESRALELRAGELDAHPQAGMVVGPTLYWRSWAGAVDGGVDSVDFPPGRGPRPGVVLAPPVLLGVFRDEGLPAPCMCGVLARRAVLTAAGGLDERFTGLYEDQVFYARMGLAAPVAFSGLCLARYRQHPSSACARARGTSVPIHARRVFLDWLAGELERTGHLDPALRRRLRRELRRTRLPARLTASVARRLKRLRPGLALTNG